MNKIEQTILLLKQIIAYKIQIFIHIELLLEEIGYYIRYFAKIKYT